MGSVEGEESEHQCRKRVWEEEAPLATVVQTGIRSALPKRPCTAAGAPEYERQLKLLEDLCGLDSIQEGSLLESGAQEDLVLEMMRSLEKVIGTTEESAPRQPSIESSSQLQRRTLSGKTYDNPEVSATTVVDSCPGIIVTTSDTRLVHSRQRIESIELEVDLKYLLEASDDDLGIPPGAYCDAQQASSNVRRGNLLFDAICDDPKTDAITDVEESFTTLANQRQNFAGVLDGYVDEMPIFVERDYWDDV